MYLNFRHRRHTLHSLCRRYSKRRFREGRVLLIGY
jgi:hypothetical protein